MDWEGLEIPLYNPWLDLSPSEIKGRRCAGRKSPEQTVTYSALAGPGILSPACPVNNRHQQGE